MLNHGLIFVRLEVILLVIRRQFPAIIFTLENIQKILDSVWWEYNYATPLLPYITALPQSDMESMGAIRFVAYSQKKLFRATVAYCCNPILILIQVTQVM
jgi:hypothetical protein